MISDMTEHGLFEQTFISGGMFSDWYVFREFRVRRDGKSIRGSYGPIATAQHTPEAYATAALTAIAESLEAA